MQEWASQAAGQLSNVCGRHNLALCVFCQEVACAPIEKGYLSKTSIQKMFLWKLGNTLNDPCLIETKYF